MPQNEETEPLLQGANTEVSKDTLIWILIGLWSAAFFGALETTVVATLISPIGSHFRQSHKATYIGTSYLLSMCCFTPLYGRLSDILGRKGAMLLALTLFTSGTLFCGLAPSMDTLIVARAIAGMGGGGILTVASITVTDIVPLKQRGLYQGLAATVFGLGSGFGGPAGGLINDSMGWRWAFFLQIPPLLASMAIVYFKANIQLHGGITAHTMYEKLRRMDWPGSLALVGGVSCFLLGLSLKTSEDIAWSNPLVWGLLTSSVFFGLLFVVIEAYWSVAPIIPLKILTKRTPAVVAIGHFLERTTTFSMLYNVPLYFSVVRLTTTSDAGLHLLPYSMAIPFGSVITGWIIARTGKLYNLTVASSILIILSHLRLATWNEKTPAFAFWFDVFANGFAVASLFTSLLIALISSVPRENAAVATGIFYLFRSTGQVTGVALSGALVQAVLLRQLRKKISGPGSEQLIQRIRHETGIIATLDPPIRKAAVDSYAVAIRTVFICQATLAVCALLSSFLIEENPSLGSREGQAEQDRQRRESRFQSD